MLEADPVELEKVRLRHIIENIQVKKHQDMNKEKVIASVHQKTQRMDLEDLTVYLQECKDDLKAMNLQMETEDYEYNDYDDDDYDMVKSSASCYISDIQNIIFGPTTSRFWVYRKHMICQNQLDFINEDNVSFFSWQCLTL